MASDYKEKNPLGILDEGLGIIVQIPLQNTVKKLCPYTLEGYNINNFYFENKQITGYPFNSMNTNLNSKWDSDRKS